MRNVFRNTVIAISLLLVFPVVKASDAKPNVLLVFMDDHSYPHLGVYGDDNCLNFNITPHMDAFAREAVLFNKAYVVSPQGAPSRISVFTGRSPLNLMTLRYGHPAAANVPFFTDVLKDNGYWVGLAGAEHHLNGTNLDQPHQRAALDALGVGKDDFKARFNYIAQDMNNVDNVLPLFQDALDEVPASTPFFLSFGISQPSRPFVAEFPDVDLDKLILPSDFPDLSEVRKDYARYLQTLKAGDDSFGKIIAELKVRNLYDNTIIILMGDNGESLLRGKGSLNDRGVHVPLVVRYGDKYKTGANDNLVSALDISATILDAAGFTVPEKVEGLSFLSALENNQSTERQYIYSQRGWHPQVNAEGQVAQMLSNSFDMSRAVFDGRYLLIYNIFYDIPYAPADMWTEQAWIDVMAANANGTLDPKFKRMYFSEMRDIFQLYDLKYDPFQQYNLFQRAEMSDIQSDLMNNLSRWMLSENDFLPAPNLILDKIQSYIESFSINEIFQKVYIMEYEKNLTNED